MTVGLQYENADSERNKYLYGIVYENRDIFAMCSLFKKAPAGFNLSGRGVHFFLLK